MLPKTPSDQTTRESGPYVVSICLQIDGRCLYENTNTYASYDSLKSWMIPRMFYVGYILMLRNLEMSVIPF